ncbi:MAG: lysylphosphatidylglycerol synthase transmembrane domain-containing protein [Gammaproteobacteria bacterium]|nr:lysylphosphatidylglycerol synthase transmembrane domain-containing protein [Gammaproteobacteria bacterium]MDE0259211.1 lysylphosphatidylglycerol synthase transmembrane domain-containing protein [Gammaproteobacteria bacterium]
MTSSWKPLLGLSVSALLLWWVFRGEDLGAIAAEVAAADPWWLLASVFVATAGYLLRAMRWQVLLTPLRSQTGLRARFAATTIGFMVNNLLPARAGEFARAWSLARMARMRTSACLSSLVVERLFDGITVVALLVVSLSLPGFRADSELAGELVGGAVAGFLAVLAIVILGVTLVLARPYMVLAAARALASRLPDAAGDRALSILDGLVEGLGALRSPILVARTAVWSLAFWLWHSASFWLGFRAFGIDAGYAEALFLNGITALAVALPSAPGFFGPFEAAVRVALVGVLGIGENPALAFAAGYHVTTFIPVTAIGLWYFWRMGFSFRQIGLARKGGEEAVPAR